MCWKCPNVKFWAFGHTQYNSDFRDEEVGKMVVTNQKAYYAALPSSMNGTQGVPFDAGEIYDVHA